VGARDAAVHLIALVRFHVVDWFFFYIVRQHLARCEAKRDVDDDGKGHGAEDTDRSVLCVNCDRCQRSGGHGDDGDDDGCLGHGLRFDLKDQFHAGDGNWRSVTARSVTVVRASGTEDAGRRQGWGDSRREEGSAGTIGLGTIFRTHGKAHDLQVLGK